MHILLIHQAFAALDEAGGTRHHELARYLVDQGHKVTVITSQVSYLSGLSRGKPRWLDRQQDESGITILRTYTYPAIHRSFFHRLISFFSFMISSFWVGLSVAKVDLLWGTSPPIFQGVTAWGLACLKHRPFLFEVRDLWPAFAIAVGVLHNPLLVKASLWLERFLYRHADRVIVNSPGYVEHVRTRGARQIDLIPNSADPAMFDPASDGSSFRKAHDLEEFFIVMYAGAHGVSNNLEVVLQAAALLKDRPNIRFVLIGDGKEKANLQAQAIELQLDNVLFLPPVPKKDMPQVLAAADACVAILKPLELYKTTYPNKVFDYMAAGRPVILAIDGVVRQVLEKASAGIPVCPGDPSALAAAVIKLANDPASARRMGFAGHEYIEHNLSRSQSAEKLTRVLEDMVMQLN